MVSDTEERGADDFKVSVVSGLDLHRLIVAGLASFSYFTA